MVFRSASSSQPERARRFRRQRRDGTEFLQEKEKHQRVKDRQKPGLDQPP
jgi:hypothetical protein